jgi:molybdate transport system substrate-binding protein
MFAWTMHAYRRSTAAAGAVLTALLLAVGFAPGGVHAETVTVFAAASLTDALTELGRRYEQAHPDVRVRFSFAASSAVARQIEAGAPADIFASANEEWMDYLSARALIVADSRRTPIGNSLVLIAPADGPIDAVALDRGVDLAPLLGPGRLAVGDPAYVPAGAYAEKALAFLGTWSAVEPRLARAESVRAAMALVARGEAPLGIVYATDAAIDPKVKVVGRFPPASHPPIVYPYAIVAGRDAAPVRRVFDHLTGSAAKGVYESFGFVARSPSE